MNRLRWKLLLAMLAVVIVTVGVSAVFTRHVTFEEMRRVMIAERRRPDLTPLLEHHRTRGSWDGVEAVLDRMPSRFLITTRDRELIAASKSHRDAKISVDDNDRITLARPGVRLVVQVAPIELPDAYLYVLPREDAPQRVRFASLERRLFITFAAATLAAVLLTLLLSRRITRPIERLTLAVETMTRGGRPAHVEVAGNDEIAQLARSFNTMADALSEQEDLRRRMVSDVAHELRTPLTNLRCELESIQDGLTSADPARIASLHEEVLHLGRLVDDLQDLAVAEAGGLQLQRTRVDIAAIAAHVIDRVRSNVVLHSEPVEVDADATRIAQIIRNLVTNAVQHTPEGGAIEVDVRRGERDAVVAVTNSGPRIPPAELERVFERFYRVDEARGRERGGAGLGLAIVRRLVELHGGRVWAENTERGARFTFTIPLPS